LQTFLENNVPKSSKKQKVLLGVADPKIGAAVSDELKIQCSQTGVAPEIIRGW
jgi:nucleolar protein 56